MEGLWVVSEKIAEGSWLLVEEIESILYRSRHIRLVEEVVKLVEYCQVSGSN